MRLETERLILRPFRDADLPDIIDYGTDPAFFRYLPVENQTAETIRTFFNERMADQEAQCKTRLTFAVADRDTDRIFATVRLGIFEEETRRADIGYAMNLARQGQGYMTEAVARVMRHAFEDLAISEIWATVDRENAKSWQLMQRLGMQQAEALPPLKEAVGAKDRDFIYRIDKDRFFAHTGPG